ncbi:MAG: hypothetical protein HRS57_03325 [Mycoplasmataceae bacterium]|nr:hypothetical protein [Mycoplasmataceae bacterium]
MEFKLEHFIEWAEEVKSSSREDFNELKNTYENILKGYKDQLKQSRPTAFILNPSSKFIWEFIRYDVISRNNSVSGMNLFSFLLNPYNEMKLKKYFDGTLYEQYQIQSNIYDAKKLDNYILENLDSHLEEFKEWRFRALGMETDLSEILREINNFKMDIKDLKKDIKEIKIIHIAEAFGEATGIPWASFILKRFAPAIVKLSDKTRALIEEDDYTTKLLKNKKTDKKL